MKVIFIQNVKDFFGGLRKKVAKFENESNNLQGEGIEKIITSSKLIDIYTRIKILLGLKLSGYPKFLTEASNLIDQLYKRNK